jgi:hypothetical protein
MTDVALSIMALIAGGVTLELFAAGSAWAPLGYNDQRGFHLVTDTAEAEGEFQVGNAS